MANQLFQERLKQAMKKRGVKQAELARRVGIDRSSIWGYLHENMIPKQERLITIANVLGVSPDWLLGIKEQKAREHQERIWQKKDIGPQDIKDFWNSIRSIDGMLLSESQRQYLTNMMTNYLDSVLDAKHKKMDWQVTINKIVKYHKSGKEYIPEYKKITVKNVDWETIVNLLKGNKIIKESDESYSTTSIISAVPVNKSEDYKSKDTVKKKENEFSTRGTFYLERDDEGKIFITRSNRE